MTSRNNFLSEGKVFFSHRGQMIKTVFETLLSEMLHLIATSTNSKQKHKTGQLPERAERVRARVREMCHREQEE